MATTPKLARREAAPLGAWVYALLFAVLAASGFAIAAVQFETPPSQAFIEFNRARVEAFARSSADASLRVVIFGNSRMKAATLEPDDLRRLADQSGLHDARFLRLVNNGAVFEDFAPLADDILATSPDVLIFQLEMAGLDRVHPHRLPFARDYVEWLLLGRGPWNPGRVDQHDLQYRQPCWGEYRTTDEEVRAFARDIQKWMTVDLSGHNARLVRTFLRVAVREGIRVVFVRVPMSPAMEAIRPSMNTDRLRKSAGYTELRGAIEVWDYSRPSSNRLYCDALHMGDAGRQQYSTWLMSNLSAWLRRTGGTAAWRTR